MRNLLKLLSEKELCDVLNVSRLFLMRCRENGMPFIRLGSKLIRYDLNAVITWFEKDNDLKEVKEI